MTLSRVKESFNAQTMMSTLGAEMKELSKGICTIRAPILPGSRQQQGFGHAALTFAIGDSAAGYAALSVMPEDREVMTVEMKINLIAPAAGDHLEAVGRVEKAGKRLVVVAADVFAVNADSRRKIALLQGTMIPVET